MSNALPTILIVDDVPDNIELLRGVLKDACKVKATNNGEKALSIARAENPPDLILLDILMPGMSGLDVIKELKGHPATADIPVIFITAISDIDGELEGFDLGAVDYITKPFNAQVVRARVFTQLALRRATQRIETQNHLLLEERELVEDIVNRMQRSRYFDARHLRYLIAPLDRTNGDILLSSFTPDGRQWVLVGDMTGHGLPAAVGCPLVSYIFYRHAAEGVSADSMFSTLNAVMYEQLPLSVFMVCILVEVATDRQSCQLWNAAMPDALLRLPDNSIRRLGSGGTPLGITNNPTLLAKPVTLETPAGSHLYMYSDGVNETENPQGAELGIQGVANFVQTFHPAQQTLDDLKSYLVAFRQGDAFSDDISFVELSLGITDGSVWKNRRLN